MPREQIPPPAPPAPPTCARVAGSPGRSARSRPAPRTRGCGSAGTPPAVGTQRQGQCTALAATATRARATPFPGHRARGQHRHPQPNRLLRVFPCVPSPECLAEISEPRVERQGTGRREMILQREGCKCQESAWKSSHGLAGAAHQECVKPRKG